MKYIILSVIFLFLIIWSFFVEPKMLKVTEFTLNDEDLSGLKVVFAGDLHIRPNQEKRLIEVVDKINVQNPDIILFAGDFAAGHSVMGNHDYWADYDDIKEMLEGVGIKVLANSNEPLTLENGKTIYIAGVDDLQTKTPDVEEALKGTENTSTIFLTHSPDVFVDVPKGNVKLTLAGHVHGGQVRLPFIGALIIPSKYGDKYSHGLIEEDGQKMVVTKGIGTSILPVRFNCTPEIVVINFK